MSTEVLVNQIEREGQTALTKFFLQKELRELNVLIEEADLVLIEAATAIRAYDAAKANKEN